MQKARYLVALSCACSSAACGTEVAQAIDSRSTEAGTPGPPEKPPQCLSTKITDRITHGSVALSEGVRYKRTGYFFGLPQDDRIAISSSLNNVTFVAWVNSAGTGVRVTQLQLTPLAMSAGMTRVGPDYEVEGTELSGLVALEDGFALLTRRPDLGDPLGDGMTQLQATYFVRWQNGRELFAVPLTGTKSITNPMDISEKRDFPNGLSGRLAFNGSSYGAYFSVRGFDGPAGGPPDDRYPGHNGDKFVQLDDNGRLVRAWRMGCRQHLGGRIVAESSRFVTFCMSDGTIGDPGLNLVRDAWAATRLAYEHAPPPDDRGYAGGNLGSAVKTENGYLVAWASRGVSSPIDSNSPDPLYDSHEPAVVVLADNFDLLARDWPFFPQPRTSPPAEDAVNVHAARYGDKVLVVWETIKSPQFRPGTAAGNGFSTGVYGGTHFRLVDGAGKAASVEESLLDAIAPNGPDEIVRMSNGDLVWAYVPEPQRDFESIVNATTLPYLPMISEIRFVRLAYCVP